MLKLYMISFRAIDGDGSEVMALPADNLAEVLEDFTAKEWRDGRTYTEDDITSIHIHPTA